MNSAMQLLFKAMLWLLTLKTFTDRMNHCCFLQLTFGNYIAVDEVVRYTPHPSDCSKTLLRQEAVVTVRGVPLTNYMEDLLASKISFNANKVTLLEYYRFRERYPET